MSGRIESRVTSHESRLQSPNSGRRRLRTSYCVPRDSHQGGFALVEVLLAVALFSLITASAVGAIVYGQEGSLRSGDRARGIVNAEEGLEATRNIRDAGA